MAAGEGPRRGDGPDEAARTSRDHRSGRPGARDGPGRPTPDGSDRAPDGIRPGLDRGSLPAPARWVLAAERGLLGGELPPALRRDGDPETPSRAFLLAVMLVVGAGAYLVLYRLPPSSGLRVAAAPAVLALWAAKVVTIRPGRLAGTRFGPWLPAVGWWLGALVFLEVFLEGWARPRAGTTALEALLAGAAGLVAWGKARLEQEA